MDDKQIIGYIELNQTNVTAETIVAMENAGADAVLLMDGDNQIQEEQLIKLIKAANSKSDMP